MSSQVKGQILAVSDVIEGESRAGRKFKYKICQIFVDGVAGNHRVYGETDEELNQLSAGFGMFTIAPLARDRGNVEFSITKVTPVLQQPKAAQTA